MKIFNKRINYTDITITNVNADRKMYVNILILTNLILYYLLFKVPFLYLKEKKLCHYMKVLDYVIIFFYVHFFNFYFYFVFVFGVYQHINILKLINYHILSYLQKPYTIFFNKNSL